ncbi:MAG: hypothetical protein ABR508_11100 [Candidatus Baltobacteraceae bacterium]
MNKLFAFAAAAATIALSACAHGGNNGTIPGTGSTSQQQAMKAEREAQRVTSTFVAAKHPGLIAETPQRIDWHTGISEAGEAPVPGGMFAIENQYNAVQNGRYVTVYAGAQKTDGQGILLIVERSADLHSVTVRTQVVAPSSVRIEGAQGGQLQLRESASGRAVRYDV